MAATILNIYYSDYSEYLFILIRGRLLHFFSNYLQLKIVLIISNYCFQSKKIRILEF